MSDYASTTHAEHLRLAVLRLLSAEDGGYSANDSVLADALPRVGFNVPRDRVRTVIGWLAEQGLVEVEKLQHLTVATITERGLDVAAGRANVPGVKRPSPRA